MVRKRCLLPLGYSIKPRRELGSVASGGPIKRVSADVMPYTPSAVTPFFIVVVFTYDVVDL